jgi:hypothetical protein
VKRTALIIIISLLFCFSGCITLSDSIQKVVPPKNKQIPVSGKWIVEKVNSQEKNTSQKISDEWIGKYVQFSNEFISLGNYILENPDYITRNVDKEKYLLYNHENIPQDKINKSQIDVITAASSGKFFCNIIKLNDDELLMEIYDYDLYLKKVSDETDDINIKSLQSIGNIDFVPESNDKVTRSGIFLGLKSYSHGVYSYRTLWIASKNKKIRPVLQTSGIFFPRRNGFYKIIVDEGSSNGIKYNVISACNVLNDENKNDLNIDKGYSVQSEINYIGNDFICLETKTYNSIVTNLSIVPVDSLPAIKPVNITDLSGNDGTVAVSMSMMKLMNTLNIKSSAVLNKKKAGENIGIYRKMGHWFYKGRLFYIKEGRITYSDYDISIVPPQKLIFYDELSIPWTEIKDRVPDAADAYVSPNKDIALILTSSRIYVYSVNKGKLSNVPLKKIVLKSGETAVMAEWATGDYADNWEKTFLNYK